MKNSFLLIILFAVIFGIYPIHAASADKLYHIILDDDSINPVTAAYIMDAIDRAEEDGQVLIIQLDTPGGLLSSTRTIVKRMLTAKVPIVVYIAPAGARAGSAGVFITYASHIAAMAPSTNIGAAHPVTLGGGQGPEPKQGHDWRELRGLIDDLRKSKEDKPEPDDQEDAPEEKKSPSQDAASPTPAPQDEAPESPMESKILNDTVAFIRAIAHERGRNVDWGVESVTESASITDEEAMEKRVVEVRAHDMGDLLRQLDGRTVKVEGGERVLNTTGVHVELISMDVRQKFFNVLADPNIAYFLLILGFYGLLFEITHPGIGISGVLGAIFLILAFYSMQTLPTNYAGLALMILGLVLLIAEAFTPAFGLLTLGGLVCLVLGSLLLFESVDPLMRVSKALIFSFAATTGLITFFLLGYIFRIRRKPAHGGMSGLSGEEGEVMQPILPGKEGKVFVRGELWNAVAEESIEKGEKVVVEEMKGMKVKVKKLK